MGAECMVVLCDSNPTNGSNPKKKREGGQTSIKWCVWLPAPPLEVGSWLSKSMIVDHPVTHVDAPPTRGFAAPRAAPPHRDAWHQRPHPPLTPPEAAPRVTSYACARGDPVRGRTLRGCSVEDKAQRRVRFGKSTSLSTRTDVAQTSARSAQASQTQQVRKTSTSRHTTASTARTYRLGTRSAIGDRIRQ